MAPARSSHPLHPSTGHPDRNRGGAAPRRAGRPDDVRTRRFVLPVAGRDHPCRGADQQGCGRGRPTRLDRPGQGARLAEPDRHHEQGPMADQRAEHRPEDGSAVELRRPTGLIWRAPLRPHIWCSSRMRSPASMHHFSHSPRTRSYPGDPVRSRPLRRKASQRARCDQHRGRFRDQRQDQTGSHRSPDLGRLDAQSQHRCAPGSGVPQPSTGRSLAMRQAERSDPMHVNG